MKRNKEFITAGIHNLMKTNYGLSPHVLDVNALVDSELSFRENWYKLKPQILQLCEKDHKILWCE